MSGRPLVLYVPGLKPKPEAVVHRQQLLRCLLRGINRLDPEVARNIDSDDTNFEIVSWTYDFYGRHRDIKLDIDDIDALQDRDSASDSDMDVATSWNRRLLRSILAFADTIPAILPSRHFATEEA